MLNFSNTIKDIKPLTNYWKCSCGVATEEFLEKLDINLTPRCPKCNMAMGGSPEPFHYIVLRDNIDWKFFIDYILVPKDKINNRSYDYHPEDYHRLTVTEYLDDCEYGLYDYMNEFSSTTNYIYLYGVCKPLKTDGGLAIKHHNVKGIIKEY